MRRTTAAGWLIASALTVLTALPATAGATWAGASGLITYSDYSGIHAIEPDGNGEHLLVAGATRPVWARGGRELLFFRNGAIVRADADGTDRFVMVQRGRLPDVVTHPSWAPGGKRIAFGTIREHEGEDEHVTESHRIYTIDRDGTQLHKVTRGYDPVWSRSGRFLLYSEEDGDIARIRPNGKGRRVLVRHKGNSALLDLSPTGRRLLCELTTIKRFRNRLEIRIRLLTVDLRTGKRTVFRPVSRARANPIDPVWTPSGRRIAFVHGASGPNNEVRTARPNGRRVKRLFRIPHQREGGLPGALSWQTLRP